MNPETLAGFAAVLAGITVSLTIFAVVAPVRPKKALSISQDIFGEGDAPEAGVRYARPILDNFMPSLPEGIIPQKSVRKYTELLRFSGNPMKINPEELFVLQIAAGLIGGVIGLFTMAAISTAVPPDIPIWIAPIFLAVLGSLLPYSYHVDLRDKRTKDVQMRLPEALDLLQVVIATGSTFQPALKKVTTQLPDDSFLKKEFTRIHVELQAANTIEQTLKSFAASNTSEEAASFVSAVIQSQRTGADITDTLIRQAAIARANRQARIERMIARMDSLLLVPIAGFMVPALLIIFLTPVLANIGNMMGTGMI